MFRKLGSWLPGDYKQTSPPTIPITKQFPDGKYPIGQIMDHPKDENRKRTTEAEYRERERLFTMDYEALRRSAEAHRQVRKYA